MNVLIDTNVVIDVLAQREPFFEHSQLILLASEQRHLNGFVSASAITDIFYIASKFLKSKAVARELLKKHLIDTVKIATVRDDIIYEALSAEWNDFEDCVQYFVGESIGADYIVTRNPEDFSVGTIKAVSPKELLNIIAPE
ncbi:MAG: PIN domain-containing protein [Acidobacteriota bacterium]|jgi:predicted nucleic-acid-binding protein|nr:PIN domain-containing protein [Acidobacteriota bacterium]